MGKNEQSQEQKLSIEGDKKIEKVNCSWFRPPEGVGANVNDPWAFKKVQVLQYKGKITQVICEYLVDEACTSTEKPTDKNRCHILP